MVGFMKTCFLIFAAIVVVAYGRSTPEDWRIDVHFSGTPVRRVRKMSLPNGTGEETQLILNAGEKIYAITRIEFPADIPADKISAFLKANKNNILREFGGNGETDTATEIGGLPGWRCVMVHSQGKRRMDNRAAVVGRFLYTMFYDAPIAAFSVEEAKTFFSAEKPD